MNASSFGRQPQVERVHDAGAEERGVVQLEELVAVQRHHREPVAAARRRAPRSAPTARRDPVEVLGVRRGVRPVDHADLVGVRSMAGSRWRW